MNFKKLSEDKGDNLIRCKGERDLNRLKFLEVKNKRFKEFVVWLDSSKGESENSASNLWAT